MGYDYRATKNGEFLLIVSNYDTGETLDEMHFTNLKPFQRLGIEAAISERD